MKIGDFPIVEALMSSRNHLIGLRDEGKITVEINGRMMPADFNVAVAPAIKLELGRRIGGLEDELRQLGVTFD